ncbi:uncharacterized protein [Leptinotarsa decemlineata]|uniref:uncharacterized protein n=1 Tax=Leptinotarsa decemlineata TaxID=7539 RepID=UPI000C253F3E|nr:uncharacterized protein LOC111513065 [Leptinotarsa decemlineata]
MAFSFKIFEKLSIIFLLITIVNHIAARPGTEWVSNHACHNADSTKREICQRCAKQTKSPIVYPMCCNEEDEVHNWCYRYTNYGKVA